jgi:UDP-3-O-[3-hydroxymyristoyl] glucosamine N-acyltransferase
MKWSHGKFLIAAAIPVIVAAVPGVTFATCSTPGQPDGPPTWDPSVSIPRTATIGWGTDIGPGVTISRYVHIGICGQIGMDGNGGSLSAKASLGDNVIMDNGSGLSTKAHVGDNSHIDGSRIGSYANVGAGSKLTGTIVSSHASIGAGSTLTGSRLSSYAHTGSTATLTGTYMGYKSGLGDTVTIDTGTRVNRYANVDSNVNIVDNVYIGANAHICADITTSGMYIGSRRSYGCP